MVSLSPAVLLVALLGLSAVWTSPVAAADTLTIDATSPTVTTFALQASSDTGRLATDGLTNALTLVYDLAFSEPVSGLTADDFGNAGTAPGCTFTPSAESGTTFTVNADRCDDGTVIATMRANAVTDAAGISGPDSNLPAPTVTVDRSIPSVALDPVTPSPTSSTSLTFGIFSLSGHKALDCGTLSPTPGTDFNLNGISALGNITGSGTTTCTIPATSSIALGSIGTSALATASGFSVADDAGNAVTSASRSSASITVDRRPPDAATVTLFTPATGGPGLSVTLTGTNLIGAIAVTFNGAAAPFAVLSATSIVTSVPASATTGPFTVTTPVGTATSSSSFIASKTRTAPKITSFSPTSGPAGTAITITGTNLAGVTAAKVNTTAVGIGGTTVLSTTSIRIIVPAGATSGKLTVTTAGGNGSSSNSFTVAAAAGPRPTQISAGASHTCALLADGTVRCWGRNSSGQLGNGTTTSSGTPVTVLASAGVPLTGITAISVGGSSTCALLSTGALMCWGLNSSGQLGNASTTSSSYPVAVSGITTASAVTVGASHACAILGSGTTASAMCWGLNSSGQLGIGTTTSSGSPATVLASAGVTLTGITGLSAGGSSTCALRSGGAIKCWGLNGNGQLGNGSTSSTKYAVAVSGISTATVVTVGTAHACAILGSGTNTTVKCWGLNSSGQLGDGTTTKRTTPVAVLSAAGVTLSAITAISAGGSQTCAILGSSTTAEARCWGLNSSGQLGNGTTTKALYPVSPSGSTTTGIVGISAGGSHTVALVISTTLPPTGAAVWGLNSSGQLGDGTTTTRTSPVLLAL